VSYIALSCNNNRIHVQHTSLNPKFKIASPKKLYYIPMYFQHVVTVLNSSHDSISYLETPDSSL
jgi:hypothetical protein